MQKKLTLLLLSVTALLAYSVPSFARDVQVFPPMKPYTTTICPPVPAGANYTYTLVWNGVNNVWCSQVPINCTAGQGLQYSAVTGNFICVTPCSGPSTTQVPTPAACTATGGVQGVVIDTIVTQCDGTRTATEVCQPPTTTIPTTSVYACPLGTTLFGAMVNGVLDVLNCNTMSCSNYLCTQSGLQPE